MLEIRCDLQNYIMNNIIPEYRYFDQAHGIEHIMQVIDKSLFLAQKTGADMETVYVIAAYHDIGMKISRDGHSFYSAQILGTDEKLQAWFSEQWIYMMAQAVEDHSTSLKKEPRSLYGKIIYQADKVFDAEIIVKRAFLFGIAHYREYSFAQQVDRVYKYVNNKYGEGGEAKLWIDIPEEQLKLYQLRIKLKDKNYVSSICRLYYNLEYVS